MSFVMMPNRTDLNQLEAAGFRRLRVRQHRWWRPVVWATLVAFALLGAWHFATSGALLAADPIALSEPWRFVDESKPGAPAAAGGLTVAPANAPVEVAAHFEIHSSMQALALQLHKAELAGLPLGQVDELHYCTRLVNGPRPYAVMLQLNIDADVTDDDRSWQGRLVYTPSHNGAVIQGDWQCWNTLTGKWWATGGPVAESAHAADPQPLGTLLAHFPHLGINAAYAAVVLKAGDGWTYFEGEAGPVVVEVDEARFDVAFGIAPAPDQTQVLLPVLLNEEQVSPGGESSNDKPQKEDKESKEKPNNRSWRSPDWNNLDWDNVDWSEIDWDKVDWDKVDWDNLNWVALGWYGVRGDAVRAFVEDVKQCRSRGWAELGFGEAGECVAYFVQTHVELARNSSYLNWGNFEWDGERNNFEQWDNRSNQRNRSGD